MRANNFALVFVSLLATSFSVAGLCNPLAVTSPVAGSVRSDLVKLQLATGLTVAWYEGQLNSVAFDNRSIRQRNSISGTEHETGTISPDGHKLAVDFHAGAFSTRQVSLGIVDLDGANRQDFPAISGSDMCWSRDNSKLAMTFYEKPSANLGILDLSSTDRQGLRILKPDVEQGFHFTSQCWSADGGQVVYELGGSVRILDIAESAGSERIIAKGSKPTWSPDGKSIAFLDGGTYYQVSPSGGTPAKLFYKKNATSGLFWSPDSRFAAYVSLASFLEGGLTLDAEIYRLRVRRLQDNAEDWVATGVSCCLNYEWVLIHN
jgi:Tol biopolymer transport system component